MRSDQLTADEYQPITETRTTGGSPAHMDIPIHRTTLLSGELHARLDPVAYPQVGTKYAGTVNGVRFPASGVALRDELNDRSGDTYSPVLAGRVVPTWSSEPVRTSDTFGIQSGWGVSVAGHRDYKLVVEIANGNNLPTQFPFSTFSAPVSGLSTGLEAIGGGKAVNAIYVIKATDTPTRANALLIKSFADAYVPPAGPHWTVTPTLSADKTTIASGVAHIDATGNFQFGVTYTIPDDAPTPHTFGYSTVSGPGDFDQAGMISMVGQNGTITELWLTPSGAGRAGAVLVQTF